MQEEAVSAAASICVFLEELQIREDESGRRKEQKSWSPLFWHRVWCTLAWQAGIWAIVTFIVQRAVTKLNPPTAMNVDYDLWRLCIYRGGRVQVRSVGLKGAWPQGTVNGRWFFSVKNSPTALNVQQDQQEGEKDLNIWLKPCHVSFCVLQNLQELSPRWAEHLLEDKMRIWVKNSK